MKHFALGYNRRQNCVRNLKAYANILKLGSLRRGFLAISQIVLIKIRQNLDTKRKMLHFKLVLHDTIFFATCLATFKKNSFASCKRYLTRCSLGVQLAMVRKALQSLQEVETSSTFCKNPKKVAR